MSIIKGKKKLVIGALIGTIVIIGILFYFQNQKATPTEQVKMQEAVVEKNDIVVGLESDGTIDFAKVNLSFGVKGTIAEIMVKEGDSVKKGDIIAKLDDDDYQDQYQLAVAKLKEAREQTMLDILDEELKLKKLEAEIDNLKAEYEEMIAIPDAYSANEIKQKKYELENTELEYENSLKSYQLKVKNYQDDELDQNELSVQMAQQDLESTILYSPVNGTVLDLANKVGESLTDEDDFAVIHENNEYSAVTRVIEYDIGQIKVGQKVYVTVEAIPDKTYNGEVTMIDSVATTDNSGLVSYEVEVAITDPDSQLKDGMTCVINFILKEVKDALIVPYGAVKMVNGRQIVQIKEEDGQITEREIKTGFSDGTDVEVVEGLKVNETVVYGGSR